MVNAKEMALAAAKALDSKKGRDIKVLEIDKITTLADYFVICSGGSNTQINALCDEVEKELDQLGEQPLHREVDQRRVILLRLHKGDRRKWFRVGCLHQKFLRQQMLTQAEHPRLAFFLRHSVRVCILCLATLSEKTGRLGYFRRFTSFPRHVDHFEHPA